ncbi:MAG: 6,7-dimethyl-8-ribityllumazine synthase [Phycisphaerae bacterium]|jgi:6,7-dimethyl-8-ribityllumazine synthase|nr:6,7-dimethyl-8-ribityllumazine synthase [Phycisphaerae bacterium]
MTYIEFRAGMTVTPEHGFALVVSRFNSFITGQLIEGAKDTFARLGGKEEKLTIVWVPGSMELPLAAKKLAESGKYDAIVCLGAVIRGETPHFDYVAAESAKGIAQVGLQTGIPIVYGVITADTLEQAVNRAGVKAGNKGADAMMTAIEMANLSDII